MNDFDDSVEMVHCPNCGARGASYPCEECGFDPESKGERDILCPECGADTKSGSTCAECGWDPMDEENRCEECGQISDEPLTYGVCQQCRDENHFNEGDHDDLEESDEMISCNKCNGNGTIPTRTGSLKCKKCDGSGQMKFEAEPEREEISGFERLHGHPRTDESFTFDKFIDDIVVKETRKKTVDATQDTPQRMYIKKYREKAGNRIRYNGGENQ